MLIIYILLLLTLPSWLSGTTYDFTMEDESIFSTCDNSEAGVLDINGLFDTSELKTTMLEEGILVEGNLTLVWAIELTDKVELSVEVFYFDRGTWTPTVFSLKSKDFCSSMYNEKQYWYEFFTKHITNAKDVKNKCFNVPGTKMILEPYILHMKYSMNGQIKNGRYNVVIKITAFDQGNVKRPNNICMQLRGDFDKM